MNESIYQNYQKFATSEIEEKESKSLELVDVTWKELSKLNEIRNSSFQALIGILRIMWCLIDGKFDEERENKTRVGSFDVYFDKAGGLHLDFTTRFIFTYEQQQMVRKILKEEKKFGEIKIENTEE